MYVCVLIYMIPNFTGVGETLYMFIILYFNTNSFQNGFSALLLVVCDLGQ